MYLLIIMLPFFGSFVAGFFGRQLGFPGSIFLTVFCLLLSFLCSFLAFYEVALLKCFSFVNLISWIDSELLNVDWGFLFDTLTVSMCCVVTFISTLVHIYSIEYMSSDPHIPRFMCYLSFFTSFMLILVTADNFVQLFVGWEGVGLCSYLLINFWFTRIQANKAAIKAMVINRIGDFGLVLGILFVFVTFKSVDYATVFSLVPFMSNTVVNFFSVEFQTLTAVGFFLFIGAIGKSAQLGLHTWLPDAMEGPTPVSALIHAATMVTAGVFLIVRCSPIYESTPSVLIIITVVGASTAFFAATVGLLQNDLKKVIAYSTCSQLGYMIFACGLSNYSVGVFHLVNHAFFKALLFLGAGSIIHAVADEQDMRKMGGLKNLIPFTYSMIVIGSLALTGFPFLAGFYSKDLILEVAYGKFTVSGHFSYYLGSLGAFFTAFYSTRLLYLTFLSKPNGYKSVICYANDSSYYICITLGVLSIPSILIGFYVKDMVVGLGTDFWGTSIYVAPQNMNMFDAEFVNPFFKLLPLTLSFLGLLTAFLFYNFQSNLLFKLKISGMGQKIYNFLNKKWFFDKLYNEQLGQFLFNFSYATSYKVVDRGIFEILGPHGITLVLSKLSSTVDKMQTSHIYHYTFVFLVGFTQILAVFQIKTFVSMYYCSTVILYLFGTLVFFITVNSSLFLTLVRKERKPMHFLIGLVATLFFFHLQPCLAEGTVFKILVLYFKDGHLQTFWAYTEKDCYPSSVIFGYDALEAFNQLSREMGQPDLADEEIFFITLDEFIELLKTRPDNPPAFTAFLEEYSNAKEQKAGAAWLEEHARKYPEEDIPQDISEEDISEEDISEEDSRKDGAGGF